MPGGTSLTAADPVGAAPARRAGIAAAASAALVLLAAGGCGASAHGAVGVSVPTPAPRAAAAGRCAALHGVLPAAVGGQPRRTTHPASPLVAAWGPHPIVLRCGAPLPALLTPGDKRYDPSSDAEWIDGLSWVIDQRSGSYRFTTLYRAVRVEVTVPNDFDPKQPGESETDPLVDLAHAILRTIPNTDGHYAQDTAPLPLPSDTPGGTATS